MEYGKKRLREMADHRKKKEMERIERLRLALLSGANHIFEVAIFYTRVVECNNAQPRNSLLS